MDTALSQAFGLLAFGANHRLHETVDEIDLEIMGVMQ